MYYKTFLTRFVLRRHLLRRVGMRLGHYRRKLTKDLFDDLVWIMEGTKVRVVLDVGANIGFVSYRFRKSFPEAEIYSFEPNPAVFEALRESYREDRKVHALNLGVADQIGTLRFNVNANTGTSSFLEPTAYHRRHQATNPLDPVDVEVTTLDAFCDSHAIDRVDILKLDIEGYEIKALEGAQGLLRCQSIQTILAEVSIVSQYVSQPRFHEMTTFLEGYDYHLYNLDSFVAQESAIRQAVLGNAIYISGRFRNHLEDLHGEENCGW